MKTLSHIDTQKMMLLDLIISIANATKPTDFQAATFNQTIAWTNKLFNINIVTIKDHNDQITATSAQKTSKELLIKIINKQTTHNKFATKASITKNGFMFQPIKPLNTKTAIEMVYLNILAQQHINSNRFKRCPKCGNFFYQHNRKNQKYCHRICSDTGRTGRMFCKNNLK